MCRKGNVSVVRVHSRRTSIQTVWKIIYVDQKREGALLLTLRVRHSREDLLCAMYLCIRLVREDLNHFKAPWSTPYLMSFLRMISGSMVSMVKITPLTRSLSILTHQLSFVSNKAVRVLCREQKPD